MKSSSKVVVLVCKSYMPKSQSNWRGNRFGSSCFQFSSPGVKNPDTIAFPKYSYVIIDHFKTEMISLFELLFAAS